MHHGELARAETRSLSIAAQPAGVISYLRDPRKLPEWAPQFASEIRLADDHVVVNPGEGELRMRLIASPEAGTIDLVAAADPRRGAFMRVLPNRDGCELLFTLFFPVETSRDAIATQMSEVEAELERVRAACA
jgi:hypothetical protein